MYMHTYTHVYVSLANPFTFHPTSPFYFQATRFSLLIKASAKSIFTLSLVLCPLFTPIGSYMYFPNLSPVNFSLLCPCHLL